MNLILFDNSELQAVQNSYISVFLPYSDKRTEHLLKVLHKKTGDNFDAGLLLGKLGTGNINEITKDGLNIHLRLETDPPLRTPLCLGVGFPRPIQLKRLLRDCSSLGLAAVDLISTELGEKSYRDTKLLDDGGARSALIEGAIQARDTCLPELTVFPSLAAWLARRSRKSNIIYIAADNIQPQGSFSGLEPLPAGSSAVLAIGSERGWSNSEREQLEQAGFLRLSLGQRALRTETACIAATILVMEKMGLLD